MPAAAFVSLGDDGSGEVWINDPCTGWRCVLPLSVASIALLYKAITILVVTLRIILRALSRIRAMPLLVLPAAAAA